MNASDSKADIALEHDEIVYREHQKECWRIPLSSVAIIALISQVETLRNVQKPWPGPFRNTDNREMQMPLFDLAYAVLSNSPPALEISIVSPLELDERVHYDRIKQFNPDAVPTIRLDLIPNAILDSSS